MLKSHTSRGRLRRATVGLAALAVPVGFVGLAGAPANAFAPNPGGAEVFHEAENITGVTSNAIQNGAWGHEGGSHDLGTVFSLGADNGTGTVDDTTTAAVLAKIGPDATIDNLRVAFVVTSADGSAEQPTVTTGEAAGQAFTWFAPFGVGTTLRGNNSTSDNVGTLSTQAQYSAWFAAGQHPQNYDDNLVAHDGDLPGNPVSTAPLGTSILNTWADGTHISEVLYVSDGLNAQNEDTVKVGPGGKAEVAWQELVVHKLPADHSQDPTTGFNDNYDAVRTSALYTDVTFGEQTTATHTTVSADKTSPQDTGTSVTFTAHVAADSGTASGSVEFFDGVNDLGAGTPAGAGEWTFTTDSLPVGDHSIIAKFTGDSGFGDSDNSGSPFPFHINGVATPTTTAITVDPGTATAFAPVMLSATVTPHAAGSVNFHEGAHNLGTATVDTSTGIASVTVSTLGAGAHTVEADFTPADPGSFGASQDTSLPFTLAANTSGSTDSQTIQAEIAPGTIVISTPYGPANPLDVGVLALNSSATQYSGSAEFDGIDITDSRAGDLPWTATAFAHDLSDGGPNTINGQNVGLTGLTQIAGPSPTGVTFSDNPAADPAVAPGDPGTLGLGGTPHTFAHAALGLGAWQFKGTLTVHAPASTPAGTYTGTVDFTVS
jgi:hypothetical protein